METHLFPGDNTYNQQPNIDRHQPASIEQPNTQDSVQELHDTTGHVGEVAESNAAPQDLSSSLVDNGIADELCGSQAHGDLNISSASGLQGVPATDEDTHTHPCTECGETFDVSDAWITEVLLTEDEDLAEGFDLGQYGIMCLDCFEDYKRDLEKVANHVVIRAKWCMDGARTLAEARKKIYEHADYLAELEQQGYKLIGPIEDDYGFVAKR